jgi:hypothetical protein
MQNPAEGRASEWRQVSPIVVRVEHDGNMLWWTPRRGTREATLTRMLRVSTRRCWGAGLFIPPRSRPTAPAIAARGLGEDRFSWTLSYFLQCAYRLSLSGRSGHATSGRP